MNSNKTLYPLKGTPEYPWLWIGTWSMGGEGFGWHDERESLEVLRGALEKGIRHFDTAGFYAHGKSELLLRKAVSNNREEIFISTKGGLVWEGREVKHRASPVVLRKQLGESLDRLRTDYLDLYQLHWPDPAVPVSESIDSLKELQREGLIRYWGIGNLNEEEIKKYLSGEINIPHQVHFNPVHQDHTTLDAGKDCCLNCVISPLEQGLLGNGQSAQGISGIGKKDIRKRNKYFHDKKINSWNTKLDDLLRDQKISKAVTVFLWICAQPNVNTIIPGPRKVTQLKEILEFRNIADTNNLYGDGLNSVLSSEKILGIIPQNIWAHMEKPGMP